MSRTWTSKRATVFRRDSGVCHYCHETTAFDDGTTDHVVPVVYGGRDANWNLVWSCFPCNHAKGSRMPTCGCVFCLFTVHEHLRLGRRPSLEAPPPPLSYTIGDQLGAAGGDG